ncbi:hypothetical protein DFH09DRAFT_1424958 [Mycena vulgaris]|nr:hypothetical protein DFH09DRAFT_1424958 [Mycena vulgaris]
MPPTRSRVIRLTPQLMAAPQRARVFEPFDPAKHPNCRLTELFAEAGFARVTSKQIESIFLDAGHPPGPERDALVDTFLRNADAGLDASGGRIRYLGKPRMAQSGMSSSSTYLAIIYPSDSSQVTVDPKTACSSSTSTTALMDWLATLLAAINSSSLPLELAGPLQSIEAVYGVEAPEGLEKFAVVELTTCPLARPGKRSFAFDVPRRTRYRPLVAQAVLDPRM